jgi:potassium channel subfamily K member 9
MFCHVTVTTINDTNIDSIQFRKHRLERKFAQFKLDHNMTNETFRQLSDLIMNKTVVRHKWKFYDSFYFSTVVLALIGYGHRTLITLRAKIFCILYAMLGIPMWLITFQSTGERLNSILSYILARFKHSLNMKQTKISDGELLVAESLLSIVILLIGACVFSKYEKWSFFDAFYYGFITLTTIGFGDFVVLVSRTRMKSFMLIIVWHLVFISKSSIVIKTLFIMPNTSFSVWHLFSLV